MGACASSAGANAPSEEPVQQRDDSAASLAARARLEAVAQLTGQDCERNDDDEFARLTSSSAIERARARSSRLRRIGYTSVLNADSASAALQLLTSIFIHSLQNNPRLGVGGVLYYDEDTRVVLQVLEGPFWNVQCLFDRIFTDRRHKMVHKIHQEDAWTRRYEGFGMKAGPGSLPASLEVCASDGDDAQDGDVQAEGLLQLTYTSVLLASGSTAQRILSSITSISITNNKQLQIGGALFLNAETSRVLQVLEGPSGAVRRLYETISRDIRHEGIVAVSEVTVEERCYAEWGMLQGLLADWSALSGPDWTAPRSSSLALIDGGMQPAERVGDRDAPPATDAADAAGAAVTGSSSRVSASTDGSPPSAIGKLPRLVRGQHGLVVTWGDSDAVLGPTADGEQPTRKGKYKLPPTRQLQQGPLESDGNIPIRI